MAEQTYTTTEASEVPASDLTPSLKVNGGALVVEMMKANGIEVAFGVISIHNLPLVEAVEAELRFVPVRHEAAAVNAADGYARATGKIGVAITSTGTGAGNAAGSMLEALNAQSRVLHITGNINVDLIGEGKAAYHEVPRQLTMLESVSQHALRITKANQARATLAEAVALLNTPPFGPVSIDWPIDLQYTADPTKQSAPKATVPESLAPKDGDLKRAVKLMRAAKRPLIWAGGGAKLVGGPLARLADAWGAGVLSGAGGRGVIPEDHPLIIGNFTADETLDALLADADCLLTIGSHLRGNETRNFELGLPKSHIQIDVDADALGRNFPIAVGLKADTRVTVPALLDGIKDADLDTDPEWAGRVAATASEARKNHRKEIGAQAALCDALTERLPRRTVIVRDVTIPGASWGNRLLPLFDPTDNVYAAGGGIGQGLAQAIGAGVGRPDDAVLAIIGDGGFAVHLGELATLAAEAPHVVICLFNDGGYGILRNLEVASGREPQAVDLHTPDFGLLAQAMRLPHTRIATAEEFDAALARALKQQGPTLIEIDLGALTPKADPIVPAIQVP